MVLTGPLIYDLFHSLRLNYWLSTLIAISVDKSGDLEIWVWT